MKPENMIHDLLKYGNVGNMPFHSKWVWRATGLLRKDPKACWELVKAFEDPKANHVARNMIVELLASVGHAEAQAVMRKVLDSESATEGARYWDMFQRVMLVKEPDSQTGEFVLKKVLDSQENQDNLHFASAIALGGISKAFRKNGDEAKADEFNEQLLKMLKGAESETEKVAYLDSLGNSADDSNVEAISTYADDDHSSVRHYCPKQLFS